MTIKNFKILVIFNLFNLLHRVSYIKFMNILQFFLHKTPFDNLFETRITNFFKISFIGVSFNLH